MEVKLFSKVFEVVVSEDGKFDDELFFSKVKV